MLKNEKLVSEKSKKVKRKKVNKQIRICKHHKDGAHILIVSCLRDYNDPNGLLLSTEAGQVLLDEVHDVSVVADNVGLSHANINVGALGEQFCRTCGILEDEE